MLMTIEDSYRFWWRRPDYAQRFGVKIVTPPTAEPVTLEQACAHLRVRFDSGAGLPTDGGLIEDQTKAAREWCEGYAGRSYARQVLEFGTSAFPGQVGGFQAQNYNPYGLGSYIELPMGPVRGVESIKYSTDAITETTIAGADYVLDNYQEPARIYLVPGASWPTAWLVPNSVRVRYHAGYDSGAESPGDLPLPGLVKQAIYFMLGHFYENRENFTVALNRSVPIALPQGAANLIDLSGRLRTGVA